MTAAALTYSQQITSLFNNGQLLRLPTPRQ